MRVTYLRHVNKITFYREAGLVCRLYICLSFHSVTNYGIHGKPAGAIESLLTDYLNRVWVLFLRATIQVMFLFIRVYHLRPV